MNWDIVEGNWKQLKGSVQEKWGDLTNDDLDRVQGNRQKLAGLIQEKYGLAKDEAERQIDDFAAAQKETL
ncbi:CsbD family protein [Albibacillus kandeliae]|uniref:CsbD family protein n=1 Tax=Albibacillus kandeliae TaxID=2174228 RepID=UPI000D69F3FC|nr:CsbD family protein [Albibacillus kandeliae]